eukprot:1421070-Rhodomonas_salina.2
MRGTEIPEIAGGTEIAVCLYQAGSTVDQTEVMAGMSYSLKVKLPPRYTPLPTPSPLGPHTPNPTPYTTHLGP